MTPVQYKAGDRFDVTYPFSRDVYAEMTEDEEGFGTTDVPTWKVGPKQEQIAPDDSWSIADAFGTMVLRVVSVHKPGKYPTRVFFTRTWISQEGKAFGKTKCRVTTVPAFRLLAAGYRHEFVLRGCKCEGCQWPHHDHRHGESLRETIPEVDWEMQIDETW